MRSKKERAQEGRNMMPVRLRFMGSTIEYTQDLPVLRRIQNTKVEFALEKDETGQALQRPDRNPIEVWKSLGETGLCWLTKVFNKIIMTRKMSEEWWRSILVPIYKKVISKGITTIDVSS